MARQSKEASIVVAKKRKKPVSKRRIAFYIFCCIVPVIHWLIFYVFANASAFIMAFTNKDGVFSFDNFVRMWLSLKDSASELTVAFKNTFLSFAISLAFYPITVLVAYFIYKKVPGSNVFRILFFLPSIIFSVALSMIFMRMIGTRGFIAQGIQDLLNLSYTPELLADSQFANATVIFHMLWFAIPGKLIVWGGTFARIPVEVLESGELDGVNWWQEFLWITVPLVWPTLALELVLSFCSIFSAGGAVFLLTKGMYGTMTLSAWMYLQIYNNVGSPATTNVYNYMSAVGLVLTVIAITISLVIRRWTDKVFDDVEF